LFESRGVSSNANRLVAVSSRCGFGVDGDGVGHNCAYHFMRASIEEAEEPALQVEARLVELDRTLR
jgi:hypothetical protein